MEILFTIIILILIPLFFCLSGIFFSRSEFWLELTDSYSCDFKTYRTACTTEIEGRFVYCFDGFWTSNNFIDIRFDGDFIYMGHTRPFSFLVRPVRINKADLIYKGKIKYWLKDRIEYSLAGASRIKIALPAPIE